MIPQILAFLIIMSPKINIDSSDTMVRDDLTISKPIIVKISGDISDAMANSFHSSMLVAQKTGQPVIPIIIDTYGGSVYALMRMVDSIRSSKVPVATIVLGKAMSAGATLLSCGAEGLRYAAPHSTIMIHEISDISRGKLKEIISSTDETKRLNRMLFELMSVNIGKNKSYLWDIVHSKGHADWFLTPEQALEHGLINHIGIPDLNMKVKVEVDLEINN